MSDLEINVVVFGDIFCNGIVDYCKSYIEFVGWECVLLLLGENSCVLVDEMIGCGIKMMIVMIDG